MARGIPDLNSILDEAVAWAEREAARAAVNGRPLDPAEASLARHVGVGRPERVKLLVVDSLPIPEQEPLRSFALASGLLGEDTMGLSLGTTIFIRRGHFNRRVLSHELRHVHQFEEHGSMGRFLPVYLRQLAAHGYWNAPLEVDARRHETNLSR